MVDWLPDWKQEKDYAYLLDATPRQWAWEFLRRNTEYQSDLQAYLSVPEKYRNGSPRGDMTLEYFVCIPPSQQGETFELRILVIPITCTGFIRSSDLPNAMS